MTRIFASRDVALTALLILVCLAFGLTSENFRDPMNFLDRSRHWVEIGIIAIPMTFIIATGGIDLSVGSLLALCGVVSGLAYEILGLPLPVAFGLGVVIGGVCGAINGLLSSRLRVPALVTTLATMAAFRGLAMGLSQADPIRGFPRAFTDWAGMGAFGRGDFQFPYQTAMLVALVAVGAILFSRSLIGRWSIQIGENPKAARFSTVPVHTTNLLLYTASGLCCGLAAIFYTGRFATAHPDAAKGLELEVIACVVIGGTRITGGNGSVVGTFLGVLLLGTLGFGMEMQGVVQKYQMILIGVLVVTIATFNEYIARAPRQAGAQRGTR